MLPTALALLLCNMDRICLSVAIIPMSAEFGWAEGLQVRCRALQDLLAAPIHSANGPVCASSVPDQLHKALTPSPCMKPMGLLSLTRRS